MARTAMQQEYEHQAVPYQGQDEFLSCCAAMADDAVDRNERVLFLLSAPKIDALRDRMDNGPEGVSFVPMDEHGRNPARLVTLLDNFRSGADRGGRCIGVNEAMLPDRSPAAMREAEFVESLLNTASLRSWPLSLLCLYDSTAMDDAALREMRRTHPTVRGEAENLTYDPDRADALFAAPLDAAPPDALSREVRSTELAPVRAFVRSFAEEELAPDRREDLVLAANEVVTNSLQHGGGECRLAIWDDATSVICEVQDTGHISDPLVGRLAPAKNAPAGRGLWLVNHLCDLVQIRSSQDGTTIRLHVDR